MNATTERAELVETAKGLRVEAERNREMAVLESDDWLADARASCIRRAELYEKAADLLEAPTLTNLGDEGLAREELKDIVWEALMNSLGPDWSTLDGAEHVVAALEENGVRAIKAALALPSAGGGGGC